MEYSNRPRMIEFDELNLAPIVIDVKLDDVFEFAELHGIPKDRAEIFFYHYDAVDWVSGAGFKIVKWQSKLMEWWKTGGRFERGERMKTKLYPLPGKTCSQQSCRMPAVYKNTGGSYDSYYCAEHMPAEVREHYE